MGMMGTAMRTAGTALRTTVGAKANCRCQGSDLRGGDVVIVVRIRGSQGFPISCSLQADVVLIILFFMGGAIGCAILLCSGLYMHSTKSVNLLSMEELLEGKQRWWKLFCTPHTNTHTHTYTHTHKQEINCPLSFIYICRGGITLTQLTCNCTAAW